MKRFPLSRRQQRMWLVQELGTHGANYQITVAFSLHGPLETGMLKEAIQQLVRRHEALRTQLDVTDGVAEQVVADEWDSFSHLDLSYLSGIEAQEAAERAIDELSRTPIDLAQGPALHVFLLRLAPENHTLVLCLHHMMADMWSMDIVGRDLTELYNAGIQHRDPVLPPLGMSFGEYARSETEMEDDSVKYWSSVLDGAPVRMALPWDHPLADARGAGAIEGISCSRQTLAGIRSYASRNKATLFSVLLAAFQSYLYRITDQDVVNVGTFVAVRHRSELENMVGLLFDEVPVVVRLDDHMPFSEAVSSVRSQLVNALRYPGFGVAEAARAVAGNRAQTAPPFNVTMQMYQRGQRRLGFEGVKTEQHRVFVGAKYDLMLYASVADTGLDLWFNYNAALLDQDGAARLLRGFNNVLGQITSQSDPRIGDLDVVPPPERAVLLKASRGPALAYPDDASIDRLFGDVAVQFPAKVAVRWSTPNEPEQSLTYAKLHDLADNVAGTLIEIGVHTGDSVGVLVERSGWLVPAYLGVLRAGAAVVLVDSEAPPAYVRAGLSEAGATVLITDASARRRHPVGDVRQVCLEEALRSRGDRRRDADVAVDPESAAFVVRTSGTTGTSKAAVLSHRGVINQVYHRRSLFQIDTDSVVALSLSVAFSALPMQLLVPLLSGGTLAVCDSKTTRSPRALFDAAERWGVTLLEVTPSQLSNYLWSVPQPDRPTLSRLRFLVTAGEKLTRRLANDVARAYPSVRLASTWGQSEASGIMCCGFVTLEADSAEVSEGQPSSNNRLYVLDERLRPVPFGVEGIGYFAGPSVALRHVGSTATGTAIRQDPWFRGQRMVNTGDRVVRHADGSVVVRGRIDSVVKVRGNRVDLEDVENALRDSPGVHEAHVISRPSAEGGTELIAYYVGQPETDAQTLRESLRWRLPDFMQPRTLVPVECFPRTMQGKLDLDAMQAIQPQHREPAAAEPLTPLESRVAAQWERILGVRISADSDFFRLGGHSLKAMELCAAVSKAVGRVVPVQLVFERPVLRDFAAAVAECDETLTPWGKAGHHAEP